MIISDGIGINTIVMSLKWKIDPAHSKIQFKVKHMLVTTLIGHFKKFDLEVETENEDFNTTKKIEFTADINSIDTHSNRRDKDLKSANFFDASTYPQLHFTSEAFKTSGDKCEGKLTIRGVTRPVTFEVDFSGVIKEPDGQPEARLSLEGKLSRKDFGLNWPSFSEEGYSVLVSDEVKIHADVQLVRQG